VNIKQRGEDLRKIITQIREKTIEYDERESPKTNWTDYDQAQIAEMANYLDNVRDLVNEANRRITERTPPRKEDQDDHPLIQLTSLRFSCYRNMLIHPTELPKDSYFSFGKSLA